jgi:hypothetical protein
MPIPRRPRPYDKTTHDGQVVDWFTKAALLAAERRLGYPLSIVQGSYNSGRVKASGGTHDGGGVVDLKPWDWQSKVRALRAAGFAAFFRRSTEGPWPDHIHAVLVTNALLSNAAEDQADDAAAGRNGLANNGPDPHAGIPIRPFRWPYAGPLGLAKWHLEQLTPHQRTAFRRRAAARLGLTRKDLP